MERRERDLYLFLSLSSAAFLIAGILLLLFPPVPDGKIESLNLQGNRLFSQEELLELSGLRLGQQLNEDLLDDARARLKAHPYIMDVDVDFDGQELSLTLNEAQCLAILETSGGVFDIGSGPVILSREFPRCRGVPLLRTDVPTDLSLSQPRLRGFFQFWSFVYNQYPELVGRISEVRVTRSGGLTLYSRKPGIRIELPESPGPAGATRLYATVAFLEDQNIRRGLVDLRGSDALVLPGK
ncbi:MAG: POTRA domain-containing protein [Leptospiraceae bacterium]